MHICYNYLTLNLLRINLNFNNIVTKESKWFKFLGLFFKYKLTFNDHLSYIKVFFSNKKE